MPFEIRHDPSAWQTFSAAEKIGQGQRAEADRARADQLVEQKAQMEFRYSALDQEAELALARMDSADRIQGNQLEAMMTRQTADLEWRATQQKLQNQQRMDIQGASDVQGMLDAVARTIKPSPGWEYSATDQAERANLVKKMGTVAGDNTLTDSQKKAAILQYQDKLAGMKMQRVLSQYKPNQGVGDVWIDEVTGLPLTRSPDGTPSGLPGGYKGTKDAVASAQTLEREKIGAVSAKATEARAEMEKKQAAMTRKAQRTQFAKDRKEAIAALDRTTPKSAMNKRVWPAAQIAEQMKANKARDAAIREELVDTPRPVSVEGIEAIVGDRASAQYLYDVMFVKGWRNDINVQQLLRSLTNGQLAAIGEMHRQYGGQGVSNPSRLTGAGPAQGTGGRTFTVPKPPSMNTNAQALLDGE